MPEFQSASYQKGITEMKRKIDELITLRMKIIADTRPEERLDSLSELASLWLKINNL